MPRVLHSLPDYMHGHARHRTNHFKLKFLLLALVDILIQNLSVYTDCKGARDHGQRITGLYKVQPDDFEPFDVRSSLMFCT